jgi:methylglutaconyl-CoA hydratase
MACALASAKFSLSEVRLGLIPSVISPFCLERMGMTAYRRYALTAEAFDGVEAKRVGLICECVETAGQQDAWLANIIGLLRMNGPQAMKVCKIEVQAVAGAPWDKLRERTARAIADIRVTPEGQEGLRAFLEKRSPSWVD